MRLLYAFAILCCCLLLDIASAVKQLEENVDPIEAEVKEHGSKKYSKSFQKPHHHGHKHKKHTVQEEQLKEAEVKPKKSPLEVPESEVILQSDIKTSKQAIENQKQKEQMEDIHLQDLTYEENLKKDKKKKKGHHRSHSVTDEKRSKKDEQKLFTEEKENHNPAVEKVIEDSFEPLKGKKGEAERKNKSKDRKNKNKKASEKDKKSKNGKKNKKNKNKDKKW